MSAAILRKGYKDLFVWQQSMNLVVSLYTVTSTFPSSELYGLTSQIKRAAISIPSNLAEGSKRATRKDYRNFVLIAYGSCAELQTQLEISYRLGFLSQSDWQHINASISAIAAMLYRLSQALRLNSNG